jgi:hypothetical protein
MNNRILVASAVASAAIATPLLLRNETIHADPLPLDECINVGNAAPLSRLCLHQFSDHTKCVISVTRGTETYGTTTSALTCKIT